MTKKSDIRLIGSPKLTQPGKMPFANAFSKEAFANAFSEEAFCQSVFRRGL